MSNQWIRSKGIVQTRITKILTYCVATFWHQKWDPECRMAWARDQESSGRERHDQNTGGCGTGVHGMPNYESNPPHRGYSSTKDRPWMWISLLLLHVSDAPGDVGRRLISFLRLQPLQQALRRETLAEMETPRVQGNSETGGGATGWMFSGHRRATKYRTANAKTGCQLEICTETGFQSHPVASYPWATGPPFK